MYIDVVPARRRSSLPERVRTAKYTDEDPGVNLESSRLSSGRRYRIVVAIGKIVSDRPYLLAII